MAGGKDASCTGPADTDPIGLFQLIVNCDRFDRFITPDRQAVREVSYIVYEGVSYIIYDITILLLNITFTVNITVCSFATVFVNNLAVVVFKCVIKFPRLDYSL